jgi:uncharacterized protein YndB with AHSA1/START domain
MTESIVVERSIWINAPVERAWRAVTEAEQLTRGYATYYAWEIPRLEVGAQIRFHNSDTEILLATIAVLDPMREFTLRWDALQPSGALLVTSFLLSEENGGTRVTLRESGYETIPADERQEWFDKAGEGYCMSMENLKALLEGRSLPHS